MPSLTAIETAAEIAAPAARELAATAGANLREFAGSLFAREGQSPEWLLKQRRYLRPSGDSDALEDRSAEIDWMRRKSELSEAIAQRIMQPRLTEQQFFQPLEDFPKGDRRIVRKILERSAGSSTETGLSRSIDSVAHQLERLFGRQKTELRLFAASPSSPGNMLAYFYRKSQFGRPTLHFDYQGSELSTYTSDSATAPIAVFDDLSDLSKSDRATLRSWQSHRAVVAVDVNSFERAVNFIDIAKGQPAVAAKLEGLLNETRSLLKKEPSLKERQAIERVLNDGFDQSVAVVNEESAAAVQPIRTVRSKPVDWQTAFEPVVTPRRIVKFLESEFEDSSVARIAAAELLAEDVEFHTLQGMVPKLKDLQEALRLSAQRQDIDPEKDIFVVAADSGEGASDAFMTYLYKQATGIADDRIVTMRKLHTLDQDGALAGRRVVALDDAIYNGWQAESLLDNELAPFPNVALATLSSFNRFARAMRESSPERSGVRGLVHLQTDFALGVELNGGINPLYARMSQSDRLYLGTLDPADTIQTLKVFPHMASDTSPFWLRQFARKFPVTLHSAVHE